MFLELLHHLPHILLAATAAVGMGEIGSAGADIVDSATEGTEEVTDSVESSEGGDSGADTDNEGVSGEEEQPEVQQKTDSKVDWRTVPAEVKGHIQELQKSNPKLANLLQNAVYTSSTFLKEVPGGLKEIRALKTSIDQLGGLDEIKTLSDTHKSMVENQEALDTRAREGDPAVLDSLEEVAGEGFFKLVPAAMNKWAQKDRAGYNHEMSKIFVNAMREGGLVSDLNMAFKLLKLNSPEATKEAVECLNRCAEWANGINKIATVPPERPKIDPKIEEQQKNIESERTKLFNDKFSNEFGSWRAKQIKDAVSQVSGGKSLNEYQMKTLNERIVSDIRDILTTDTDYMKSLEKIYNSRDMAELQKFTRARTLKLLPEVSKKAYRSLFSGAAPVKKQVAKPNTQTDGKTTPQVAQQVKGWTKVAPDKAPKPSEIDDKKTPFEMKFRKQAILKNGQKVYWGDKVPA